jgi:hypothetical protein
MTVRRTFWILSIANWLLAVAVWSVSAYLGIARPTSLFIPTTLFVIGIFAVLAGTLCWLVARFGQPPEAVAPTEAEVTAAEAVPATPTTAVATQAGESAPAPARVTAIAAEAAVAPAAEPSGEAAPGEPGSAAERPLPAEAG